MNKRLKRVFVWLIVLAMLIGLGAAVSARRSSFRFLPMPAVSAVTVTSTLIPAVTVARWMGQWR